jgi:hypothetical protein
MMHSPSLLVVTVEPSGLVVVDDADEPEDEPLEPELAGPVVEDETPPGPAVTELDIPPAVDLLELSAWPSTRRQGLPSGPVVTVFPSGPVEVETDPPGPELDEEDELDWACAAAAPTRTLAATQIAVEYLSMVRLSA